jgi:hypothetical protein
MKQRTTPIAKTRGLCNSLMDIFLSLFHRIDKFEPEGKICSNRR